MKNSVDENEIPSLDQEIARETHVAVIIPAYRAERTIGGVIQDIPAFVRTVVVVDDASPDGTAEAARAAADPRVTVIRHEANRGVGGAMTTGYQAAIALGAEVVVKMDSDGQMDPAEMARLLEPILLGRADYAKGNRFYMSSYLSSMPVIRILGNAALSFLTKVSSGAWQVFDPTNGYTAIHRDVFSVIDVRRIHPRYFFESSMLALLTVGRAVIEDVPMPARYGAERSNLRIGRTLFQFPLLHLRYFIWRILKLYYLHDFTALSLFVLFGLPLVLFGLTDGILVWIHSGRTGVPATTGTVMIPILAIILGFQMLLHAVLLDISSVPRTPIQRRRLVREKGFSRR